MPLSSRAVITRAMAMLAGYDWRDISCVREEPDGFMRCEISDSRSMSGVIHARYRRSVVMEVGDILQGSHGISEPVRDRIDVIPRTYREHYLRGQESALVWRLGDGNVLLIYANCSKLVLFRFADWSVLHIFSALDLPDPRGRMENSQQAHNRILRELIDQVRIEPAMPVQQPLGGSQLCGFPISEQTANIMRAIEPARRVRARIEHRCTHCGGAIPAGETYRLKKQQVVGRRAWVTVKMHDGCYNHVLLQLTRNSIETPTWQHLTTMSLAGMSVDQNGRIATEPVEFRNTATMLDSFTEVHAIVWQAVGHKTCGYYEVFKDREKATVELEAVKQRDPTRLYTLQTVAVIE